MPSIETGEREDARAHGPDTIIQNVMSAKDSER